MTTYRELLAVLMYLILVYVTFISFTFFFFFFFWYYVDVFIAVVTFQNVDYTCTQTVVIMVLLE